MNEHPQTRPIGSTILAIVLWLVSFGLALQSIYIIKEIVYLITVRLGGSVRQAENFLPTLIFILALLVMAFIIGSTEYHMKRVGKPESWRLFGWTIAVELSLLILYYIL